MQPAKYRKTLIWLILISTAVRAFLAAFLELGNDEVYYWTYALFPDWSHFDHPPMVGFLIQIFTFDLYLDQEFFLRLGSVVLGSVNLWIIYKTGKLLRNERTGLYAAMLYTGSVYCFIIVGVFILPDTPQLFFWLSALFFFLRAIKNRASGDILLAGALTGLAMLSKYTSAYLWAGILAYVVFHERHWLRRPSLYLSMGITLLLFVPVIVWNVQSDWISFAYQGGRVSFFGSGLRPDYLLTEMAGQFFYNNPVNIVLVILALAALSGKHRSLEKAGKRVLLWTSLPLILSFILFSLVRPTLPHWSAPGYLGLLLFAGAWLDQRTRQGKRIPTGVWLSWIFLGVIIVAGVLQIRWGMLYHHQDADPRKMGEKDISLDLYGWKQTGNKFREMLEKPGMQQYARLPIITYRWFPAAHLDYYLARRGDHYVLATGSPERIHKYVQISRKRGGFRKGMNALYLTSSRDFKDPEKLYGKYFSGITPLDTLRIRRNHKPVFNVFVYLLKDMQEIPDGTK